MSEDRRGVGSTKHENMKDVVNYQFHANYLQDKIKEHESTLQKIKKKQEETRSPQTYADKLRQNAIKLKFYGKSATKDQKKKRFFIKKFENIPASSYIHNNCYMNRPIHKRISQPNSLDVSKTRPLSNRRAS